MGAESRAAPDLRYHLLGPLTVTAGSGAARDLGGHRQAAVLAALLVQANHVVSRDRLVDDVWGQHAPPTAAATLQAYLSNLRRQLEPDRARGDPARVIVRRAPGYVVLVEPEQLDVLRFEQLVARAGTRTPAVPDEARADLTEALRLWRGPALVDFPDEPFAQAATARWESQRISAEEDMIDLRLATGEHAHVVPVVEALLRQHRLRERLWGQLMLAQYRSGLQTEALETYRGLHRLLAEELGLEPGPALRRLEQAILTHAPELSPRAEMTVLGQVPLPAVRGSLVGRRAELARFATAMDRARAGRGSLLLVEGEPGIGKTRLLEAMLDAARRDGSFVALGRCFEGGGAPPYWPWVRVVRELAGTAAGTALLDDPAPRDRRLRSWLPGLGDDAGREGANPHRVAEAVVSLCRGLSRAQPLVIALDDLHGADPDSLTVLSLLAAETNLAGTVVVGSYRTADVPADHALVELLATVSRQEAVERMPLRRLGPAAVAELVEEVTGEPAAPGVASEIHRRTSGNALFAIELVRLLRSETSAAGPGTIPPGVRDVIRRRVSRLPDQTRSMLAVAAVLGRDFDLDVVIEVVGVGGGTATEPVDAVEVALRAQLVEQGEHPGRFRFSHALVQEALREDQTALRRAHLHRALTEALEARHGDDPTWWSVIAHHAVEAVPVTGPAAALAPVGRAAEYAATAAAAQLALQLRERFLALILTMPAGADRDLLELDAQRSLSRAVAAARGWVSERLEVTATRVVELALATGQRSATLAGLMTRATSRLAAGRFHEAAAVVEEIDAFAAATGLPLAALCGHLNGGITAYYLGRTRQAQRRFLAGEELLGVVDEGATGTVLEPPGQQSLLASYWAHRAALTCLLGDEGRAREQARLALAYGARGQTAAFGVSVALVLEATLHYLRGDPRAALQSGRRAVADARAAGYAELEALGAVTVAWGEARIALAPVEAVRTAVLAVPATVQVEALHQWGMVADANLRAGLFVNALDAVDRGLAASAATGARMWLPELYRLRAEALRSLGRRDEAAECLDRAADLARDMGALLLLRRIERGVHLPRAHDDPATVADVTNGEPAAGSVTALG
jgi:DNA-binding SARP family transcriptional activator/tetratricopeptide (TPR) repeat protein